MKDFIFKLNHDFVREFGEKMGLKDFYIDKRPEGWFLIFDNPKKFDKYVVFYDYSIYSELGDEFNKKATRLWQVEMYNKFGKKYIKGLKSYTYKKLNYERHKQLQFLKADIKKIEKGM